MADRLRGISMTTVIRLLLVHAVGRVAAFPSYRLRFPNAFRVACPPSQNCHADSAVNPDAYARNPSGYCNGVGHKTCAGGVSGAADAPALNVFGQDFAANGFKWTKALCEKDSDADGFTNGEELGDPCCVWLESYGEEELSDYTRTFNATHPGFADSKPGNSSDIVRTPAILPPDPFTAGASDHTALCIPTLAKGAGDTTPMVVSQFNAGEEEREVRLRINGFAVPSAERTTYRDFAFNVPEFADSVEEVLYVVAGEAIVDNPAVLHHFVVRGCPKKWDEAVGNGAEVSRYDARECRQDFGGWAPGRPMVATPSWAGKPVGRGVGIVAFVVNVHYDNAELTAGIISRDGILLRYTAVPKMRPYVLQEFATLQLSKTVVLTIPKKEPRWFVTRQCRVRLADKVAAQGGWNVFSVGHHAHLLGREMYVELYKKTSPAFNDPLATGQMLTNERIWHFDDQAQFFIQQDGTTSNSSNPDLPVGSPLKPTLTLHTGDILQSTCVFDSTTREAATKFDVETTDEMCWASFFGWSNIPGIEALTDKRSVFCEGVTGEDMLTGHIYMGRLTPDELVAGIGKTKHTERENTISSVISGSNLITGGHTIKVIGEDSLSCEDMGSDCVAVALGLLKQRLKERAPDAVCAEELVPQLPGMSAMDLCCATACKEICPGMAGCPSTVSLETNQSSVTSLPKSLSHAAERYALSLVSFGLVLFLF